MMPAGDFERDSYLRCWCGKNEFLFCSECEASGNGQRRRSERVVLRANDAEVIRHDTLEEVLGLLVCEKESFDDPDFWYVSERDSGDGQRYTLAEYMATIRKHHTCWGFADVEGNEIHVWIDKESEYYDVLGMLAHEWCHMEPYFELDVEAWSESYCRVAVRAHSSLRALVRDGDSFYGGGKDDM